MSMTYEDVIAFLGESPGTAVPPGVALEAFISDTGKTIANGWTTIKSGANGVVNEVRTIAAEGLATGGALLTMDVGVAGAAIAPLLGVAAGVGLYSVAPDFWNKVSEYVVAAGETIGGQAYAILNQDGSTVFTEDTIGAFKDAFAALGVYDASTIEAVPEGFSIAPPIDSIYSSPDVNIEGQWLNIAVRAATGDIIQLRTRNSSSVTPITAVNITLNGSAYLVIASTMRFSVGLWVPATAGWFYALTMIGQSVTIDNKTAYVYGLDQLFNDAAPYHNLSSKAQTGTLSQLIAETGWLLIYGAAKSLFTDPTAVLPDLFDTIGDFMDAIGNPGISIPGVEDSGLGYPLNPTAGTQEGALDPSIDWDALWDWLMNPSISIPANPAIDTTIEGVSDGVDDIANPADATDIPDDPPVQPDPDIPVPPIITPILPGTQGSGKLFEVYKVTDSDLNTLGGYLWSTDILTQLQKIWMNPLEGVIALFRVWATPTTGSTKQVRLGSVSIPGLSCPVVTNQFKRINLGSVNVAEMNKNVGDYSPYTQVSIYLPFIGIVELDTDEVMAGSINVQYVVDFWTGTCIAELRFTKSGATDNALLYVYNGNLAQQIPLTSNSFNGIFSTLLAAGSAIGTVATGGALAPTMIMGVGSMMTHDMVHVHRAGQISSNSGIMTDKKPMLIISRRNVYNATAYNEITGYPANITKVLGNCKGFTRVRGINLQVSATDAEKNEIEHLLKEGVIF